MDRYREPPQSTEEPQINGIRRSAPKPLTIVAISGLKPGQKLADGAIRPGHGSLKARRRATARGSVIEFIFAYQHEGKTRVATIGKFSPTEAPGMLTLGQAREEAGRLQSQTKIGEDPLAKREIDRAQVRVDQVATLAKVREASKNTLGALCDEYVTKLRSEGKALSARDAEGVFRVHVKTPFPHLSDLPAASIEAGHIAHMLARMVGPSAASKGHVKGRTALKLRSFLHAAFRFGLGAALDPMAGDGAAGFGLTINPVSSVPATSMAAKYKKAGKRALSTTELRAYLVHVTALPSALTRLGLTLQLLLGGQRAQQMLRVGWDQVVTGKSITLFDPKGRRTEARPHVLPVVPEIQDVLNELAAISAAAGPIFASGDATLRHETLSAAVHEISGAMMAEGTANAPFRGGDIRRTCETMLAEKLGISKDTRAQLLSHGLGGVQDVHYDVGSHIPAKTAALRRWNDFIADLAIGNPAADNVHQLHAA